MNIFRKGFVWVIKKICLCNSQKAQFLLQIQIKDSICMHFLICTLVFVEIFKKHIKNVSIAKKGLKGTCLLKDACFIDVWVCTEVVIKTASLITGKWILVKGTNCPDSVMRCLALSHCQTQLQKQHNYMSSNNSPYLIRTLATVNCISTC